MPRSNFSHSAALGRILISAVAGFSIVAATAVNASAISGPPDLSGADISRADDGSVMQVLPADPLKPAADPKAGYAPALGAAFEAAGAGQFVVEKVFSVGEGSTVRLKQVNVGIDVFGASIAQSLAKDGSLISASGAAAKKFDGAFPADQVKVRDAAKVSAIADVEAKFGAKSPSVVAIEPVWYDPTLVQRGSNSESIAVPAYKVQLSDGIKMSWLAFVTANSGGVLDSWAETAEASSRVVCDADSYILTKEPVKCGAAPALFREARVDGQRPSKIADVNNVFDAFSDTQKFYEANTGSGPLAELIGTDGSEGSPTGTGDSYGFALRGVTRLCAVFEDIVNCPMANAFWNPSTRTMGFGENMAVDDVTAHELTHGVSQQTSGLVYRGQSGAINESMSDIFGEFVDLTNGSADDTTKNRWKLGEGSALGIIRDLKTPTAFGQPDSMSSPKWDSARERVHVNSGVGNKTAFLITDGGKFSGQSVQGIGIKKAAQLYWTAQTLLPSNADYKLLGFALKAACQQNTINKVVGTTKADCEQVAKATLATGITSK